MDKDDGSTILNLKASVQVDHHSETNTVQITFIDHENRDVIAALPLEQVGWLQSQLLEAQNVAKGLGLLTQMPLRPKETSVGIVGQNEILLRFMLKEGAAFAFALPRSEMRKVVDGIQQIMARTAVQPPKGSKH